MTVIYRGDALDAQVQWGGGRDPRGLLVPGHEYVVAYEEVHSLHTRYYLSGIEGWFNSVLFDKGRP